jgi:Zn-dependent M28 family amino/carboxypeptidase
MRLVIQLEMMGAVSPKMSLTSFAVTPSSQDALHHWKAQVQQLHTPSTAPTQTPTTSHSAPSPVDLFKRGIKRDPSVYLTLKDKLWNDNWHRSFANQARAQDLSDVLNAAYVPTTSVESELFQEKQKFLYDVLESKVETAKGKAIIRKHESSFNAQKAYAELQTHHLTSTRASLSSVKILGYITSAKIGDGSWHGTTENFNLN